MRYGPPIAVLVHLNGPPAVGKSTIATRLVADRPLALNLDIDDLRVRLGQWESVAASKQVARQLGFMLAEAHLRSGYDVVLAQLLVRGDVVDDVERIATKAGARFLEVVLVADVAELVDRARVCRGSAPHPRDLVAVDELEGLIRFDVDRLYELAAGRPAARLVDVTGMSPEGAAEQVRAVVR